MTRLAYLIFICLFALSACGDDGAPSDGGVPDGATDGGGDAGPDGGTTPAPPDIPWLADGVPPVTLTPCPEGWREVTGGHVTECDPYPEGGPATCAAGEAHFPGEPGCRPVGDACPTGDYAERVPSSGTVLYVKAGAAAGGDGTIATPYAELTEVSWSTLSAGTTVAISRGTYEGTLPLRAGVRVIGACAAETILSGTSLPIPQVVTVTNLGDAASVENLTISDPPQVGALVEGGRRLALDGVIVERALGRGVGVLDGGEVSISDVVIRGTRALVPGEFGVALSVGGAPGPQIEATRFVIEGSHGNSIYASGRGTQVTLSDTVIRDTQPATAFNGEGTGAEVREGARLVASRVLFSGNLGLGLLCFGEGTSVALTDVVIQETRPRESDGTFGTGLNIEGGASVEATRLVLRANHETAAFVGDVGSELTLEDTVIRETAPSSAMEPTVIGLDVRGGAHMSGTRLLVADGHHIGVFVKGDGTEATLADVASMGNGTGFARGVIVRDRAQLAASRILVTGENTQGIALFGAGTQATMSDVVVENSEPRPLGDLGGAGFHVEDGARLEGARLRTEGLRAYGFLAIEGGGLDLSDVTVSGVEAACVDTSCTEPFGYGIASVSGTVDVTRFEIRDAETCGVLVAQAPATPAVPLVDLMSGFISGSMTGIGLQAEGYDVDRLTNGVEFGANGEDIAMTMHPLPAPLDG